MLHLHYKFLISLLLLNTLSVQCMWINNLRQLSRKTSRPRITHRQQSTQPNKSSEERAGSWWNRFIVGFYPLSEQAQDARMVRKAYNLKRDLELGHLQGKDLNFEDIHLLNDAGQAANRLGITKELKNEQERLADKGADPSLIWIKEHELLSEAQITEKKFDLEKTKKELNDIITNRESRLRKQELDAKNEYDNLRKQFKIE